MTGTTNEWRLITNGTSRWVLLTRQYAIKVPRLDRLRRLRNGLRSNEAERQIWRTRNNWLCPIVFSMPYLLVVMKRACSLSEEEGWCAMEAFVAADDTPDVDEFKRANFGKIDGRFVLVDYGRVDVG